MSGLKKHRASETTLADSSRVEIRAPALVMSPQRAAAAYPNALSFSRSFVRKMQRDRWRIEKARITLDAEGRGEGLYRIHTPGRTFHYFAISNVFPPDQKVDRSFGINWDVSAAICQGEWTAEREAVLRQQIPLQYDGRYDNDVLCFCRGNRSERLFDHVVDSLTAGAQPDAALLATVGYILRSTAFAGNGLFGMRPFEGLEDGHPLAATYHVQMLAAFLLREFVFDLVDGMAAARSPSAAKLDRRLKRYLGVGNSAGLGLIPFVANHPHIVHQWCLVNEEALADAKSRSEAPGSEACQKLLALLDKTIRYFRQDPRDGNGIFASFARLADEFTTIARHATGLFGTGSNAPARPWAELADWVAVHRHPEAVEIFNGLLLELYPDIVAAHETRLTATERMDVQPEMTVGALKSKLRAAYGWLRSDEDTAFFWYYPVEAPYEPRRGLRGPAPAYELESNMDSPRKVPELSRALESAPEDRTVAALLADRPDLRAIVARIQSIADFPYAELHQNFLSSTFTPFATCRFLLSFYGMEKYDPRPPRSTKGALLQGAPIAEEIAIQVEGEWPFPLAPELGATAAQGESKLPPLRVIEAKETSVKRIQELAALAAAKSASSGTVTIFPLELHKLLTKALLSAGLGLGDAEFVVELARASETSRHNDFDPLLDALVAPMAPMSRVDGRSIDAGNAPAFTVAAAALDLACAEATRNGVGATVIRNAAGSMLMSVLPCRAAERGFVAALADLAAGTISVSGPGATGPWWGKIANCRPNWALDLADPRAAIDGAAIDRLLDTSTQPYTAPTLALLCVSPHRIDKGVEALFAAMRARGSVSSSDDLKHARESVDREGFKMPHSRFDRLSALAKRALVPEAAERLIVPQ